MDVDREIRVFLADGSHQQCSGVWFENTSHILDTQDVDIQLDQLVHEIQVVL
jgi:hypothetical protein